MIDASQRTPWAALGLSSLALGVTLALAIPLRIFAANAAEFRFGFSTMGPQLALLALGLATVAFLTGAIPWPTWRRRSAGVWLAAALLLWIQSSFLVWDYGVFDGKGIRWSQFTWHGWVDLAIWLGGLVAAWFLTPRLTRHLRFLAGAFLVLQLGGAVGESLTADGDVFRRTSPDSERGLAGLTSYSSSQNVVHIVLDAFQSDAFLEIVRDEQLESEFAGFTVFSDNLSACAWTQLCLPTIFSGEVYDGSQTTPEFIQHAVDRRGLPGELHRRGFVVNLIPFINMERTPHTNYLTSPRSYGKSQHEMVLEEQAHLMDISLFRAAPHRVRRWVYNDGNWRVRSLTEPPTTRSFHQKAFITDYVKALRVGDASPAYHFVHLFPPHLPYVTLPDGTFAGESLPNTRENYLVEAKYILLKIVDLLRRLRELGLYDDALIVLQGDHGSTHPPVFDGVEAPIRQDGYAGLLAVKPPQATGPLVSSPVPTSHADVPATIMALLGQDHDYPGQSVFDLDVEAPRERVFFIPIWEDNQIERYVVNGSAHDGAAWSAPERRRIGGGVGRYQWGETIYFSMDGNASAYLDRGWSFPDEGFIWTNGTTSTLQAAVEPPTEDVELQIWLRAFLIPQRHPEQRLTITVNGTTVGEWTLVDHREPLTTVVPREVLADGTMELSLHMPDARRPMDLGLNDDDRLLGASVRRLIMGGHRH